MALCKFLAATFGPCDIVCIRPSGAGGKDTVNPHVTFFGLVIEQRSPDLNKHSSAERAGARARQAPYQP